MKLLTYRISGSTQIGVLSATGDAVVPLHAVIDIPESASMIDFIASHTEEQFAKIREASALSSGLAIPLEEVQILSPIERPIHDVMCVGVNYAAHREESKGTKNDFDASQMQRSIYFGKRASHIAGPDEPVVCRSDIDVEMDYEVELAVIIGKHCKDVKTEEAEDVIFGYSVFNDFSSRKLQREHVQWLKGKSMDGYTAMGPVILTKDELPFPLAVDVISLVNGEERQHSNTCMLLNDVAGIISDLSEGMTLEPGDIIATGTPAGVAMGMAEPQWLKAGDTVICRIPQIGDLRNPIV